MVSYLQVEGLSKAFGVDVLFEDLTFGVAEGEKIGLIAKNGTGKSTLLDVLAGVASQDSGTVIYRNNLRVGYLPQRPDLAGRPPCSTRACTAMTRAREPSMPMRRPCAPASVMP